MTKLQEIFKSWTEEPDFDLELEAETEYIPETLVHNRDVILTPVPKILSRLKLQESCLSEVQQEEENPVVVEELGCLLDPGMFCNLLSTLGSSQLNSISG